MYGKKMKLCAALLFAIYIVIALLPIVTTVINNTISRKLYCILPGLAVGLFFYPESKKNKKYTGVIGFIFKDARHISIGGFAIAIVMLLFM